MHALKDKCGWQALLNHLQVVLMTQVLRPGVQQNKYLTSIPNKYKFKTSVYVGNLPSMTSGH